MSSYALTLGAKRDLYEIWSYIAEDSEESADRVVVYRPESVPLEIVALLHGRRNARRVLQSR
jgi:plasmid stabilization system protein ParE